MKKIVDKDSIYSYVESYGGIDMGDYIYITPENMIKLINETHDGGCARCYMGSP